MKSRSRISLPSDALNGPAIRTVTAIGREWGLSDEELMRLIDVDSPVELEASDMLLKFSGDTSSQLPNVFSERHD